MNQDKARNCLDATEPVDSPTLQYSLFSKGQKRFIVGLVALAAWFSTLSSFIYYPAIALIAQDLQLSIADVNLSITTYMVISSVAPSITSGASDLYGRRPVYLLTLTVYLLANIGIAVQTSFAGLLSLRMLQSIGISGAFSIAYGVVADIAMPAERGLYVAVLSFGITTAVGIGPLIGGALSHSLGWRWIFWFLCILSATCLAVMVLMLPETARGVVGNGSLKPPRYSRLPSPLLMVQPRSTIMLQTDQLGYKRLFPSPLKSLTLLLWKDNAAVVFAGAFLYVTFCCIPASLGTLFIEIYHLNQLQAGLVYLPFGIGCTLAAVASGKLIDYDYRKTAELHGLPIDRARGDNLRAFPIEEARLRSTPIPLVTTVISVIAFGWALDKRAPLPLLLIIQFVSGLALQTCFNTTNTLRVDINPQAPAAAQASSNFVRCALAAVSVAFLQSIIDRIGVGWTYTFFGCLCSLSGVLFAVERQKGMKWRLVRLGNN